MHDKYEMLDAVIVAIDKLEDARGVEKCRIILDAIQRISALKDGLKKEDDAHAAHINMLSKQIKELTAQPLVKNGEQIVGGQEFHIGVDGTVTQTEE